MPNKVNPQLWDDHGAGRRRRIGVLGCPGT